MRAALLRNIGDDGLEVRDDRELAEIGDRVRDACKPDEVDSLKASLTGGDGFDRSFEAIRLAISC